MPVGLGPLLGTITGFSILHTVLLAGGRSAGGTEEPAVGATGRPDCAGATAAGRREGAERRCRRHGQLTDGVHEA